MGARWSELRLAVAEWKSLLGTSATYEFKKRVQGSPVYGPMYYSVEIITQNVKKIAARGHAARVRLSRILMRLAASVVNKNVAAFEAAVKDLIELGKSV